MYMATEVVIIIAHLQSRHIYLDHLHFNRKCLSAISRRRNYFFVVEGVTQEFDEILSTYFIVGHSDIGYKTSPEFVQMYVMQVSSTEF